MTRANVSSIIAILSERTFWSRVLFAVNAFPPSNQREAAKLGFYLYEDDGCEVSPSCLDCPLPRCKLDDLEWFSKYRRLGRDLRMAAEIHAEGLTPMQAAQRFSVTPRTVFRVLQRCRDAMRELTPAEAAVFANLSG